jgi:ribosome-binding factor A
MRLKRIADRIKQEISEMLVTVKSVILVLGQYLSQMLQSIVNCTLLIFYVSSLEGREQSESILQGLEHASGFLRSTLADRIDLRIFPKLRFYWDETRNVPRKSSVCSII